MIALVGWCTVARTHNGLVIKYAMNIVPLATRVEFTFGIPPTPPLSGSYLTTNGTQDTARKGVSVQAIEACFTSQNDRENESERL